MKPVKETLTGCVRSDKLMQTSLQGIAKKARELKKHRFGNLYQLLNREALAIAWNRNNKNTAAGVDKVTTQMFAEHLEENLNEIVEQLKEKRYRAKLVRRVNIPKGEGKTRPLGIPAIADKLVQSAAAQILGAIYEEDFYPNSYGYRPRVGVHMAVKALSKELIIGKYGYIVEADIKGFFQNIDHDWLIKMLEQRVDDKAFAQCIYSSKPPLNIKYEDTNKFDAYDRMMRTNKGISGPM